jgi:hypothetical protein
VNRRSRAGRASPTTSSPRRSSAHGKEQPKKKRYPESWSRSASAGSVAVGEAGSRITPDRDDNSPHCSCRASDGSDEHDLECELIAEGLL